MRREIATAVILGLLLGGVARADSGWREIRSPHEVLRTDLGSGAAREAGLTVERFRAQIIAAAWPRATLPAVDRIEVTVFANGLDFEHHFGRNIDGVFFHTLPPFAVMHGHPEKWEHRATLATPETTSILRHEASQARAIDALPEGVSEARRRDFEGRLDRNRTRCRSGAPTAGSGG